ncbi:MAG: hypothetical protein HOP02_15405 [Methylococcaceae bacterium]|nr:hypothetical protein [Methylococcaceae bacterium]
MTALIKQALLVGIVLLLNACVPRPFFPHPGNFQGGYSEGPSGYYRGNSGYGSGHYSNHGGDHHGGHHGSQHWGNQSSEGHHHRGR